MERVIMFCDNQRDFNKVCELLEDGWVLDTSIYDGKPMRLEYAIVYHLAKYSEEELAELEAAEPIEPRIVSIQSVAINDADELLEQGYTVKDTFAKTVTLVKYEKAEREPEELSLEAQEELRRDLEYREKHGLLEEPEQPTKKEAEG